VDSTKKEKSSKKEGKVMMVIMINFVYELNCPKKRGKIS